MKIFTIINNHSASSSIDWYEMPDSSVLRTGNPFFVPDFADDFAAFPTAVYRIGRLGKSIAPRFAHRYIESASMAVAVIATDLLDTLRAEGRPWTRAVAFDRSCMLGDFIPLSEFDNFSSFEVKTGEQSRIYRLSDLQLPISEIIPLISADNTLKNGDLVLVGIPEMGLPLKPGQRLTISPESKSNNNSQLPLLLDINIR